MIRLVARKRTPLASFSLSLLPASLAALAVGVIAILHPEEHWHGIDSRWLIGGLLFTLAFLSALTAAFIVLAMELRARSALLVGASTGGGLAYVLGVLSPLAPDQSWNAYLVASLLVVFPLSTLMAWRLRFRRES